ncbi:MAG TPA: DUF3306 domain-containing protein, partial [Steroidobacteraceae bacterium]
MNDDESFLARWSRLKRQHATGSATEETSAAAPAEAPAGAPEVDVDLTKLPPIESLGAGSDISAYLGVGVPAELTRAALRSAWHNDPAVSGFVEMADNQWDFNAPETMPGFGALGAGQVASSVVTHS